MSKIVNVALVIFTSITLPVSICIAGYLYQKIALERQTQADYTRLAVSILVERPNKPNEGEEPAFSDDKIELRKWALELLNRNCPVQIPNDVQETIITGKTPLAGYGYDDYSWDTFGGASGEDAAPNNGPNNEQEATRD